MDPHSSKTVLVVEDDAAYRRILMDRLSRAGCRVLLAVDGEQGVEIALKEHPDVVLLDIVLPKLGGIAVLKKIRDDSWGKNTRVIMLTNLSDNEAVAAAVADGGFEYYVKADTQIEDLMAKIL